MAIKRIVSTEFWTDKKIVDQFSPEDKLFFLYLLTNPHTTQLGIYPFVTKIAAFEIGYSNESVISLLERFEKYGIIKFSQKTNEVAVKNYLKHSIVKGGTPVYDLLIKEAGQVKDKELLSFVLSANYDSLNDTVRRFIADMGIENDNENDNDNDNEESLPNRGRIVDEFEMAIKDFIDHRKKIKKPMSDRAVELLKGKLETLAPNDKQKQIDLLNTAILNGWQTVYPDKDKTPDKPKTKKFKYDDNGNVIEVWE